VRDHSAGVLREHPQERVLRCREMNFPAGVFHGARCVVNLQRVALETGLRCSRRGVPLDGAETRVQLGAVRRLAVLATR